MTEAHAAEAGGNLSASRRDETRQPPLEHFQLLDAEATVVPFPWSLVGRSAWEPERDDIPLARPGKKKPSGPSDSAWLLSDAVPPLDAVSGPPTVVAPAPLAGPPQARTGRIVRPAPTLSPHPGQGSSLVAEQVNVWFGPRKVLEDVSLVMAPGQITALIGPSGCGKSTFLRSLNRLHELVPGASLAGSVKLDGLDVYGPSVPPTETRAKIGMVFQRPNPFPAMSIAQNVLSGLRLSGRRVHGAEEIIETCLRRAGLWTETKDRLHTAGASLSGGQQQRLCIARSLAVKPAVLLMDEPCSALDPISTAVIEQTMMAIKDEITVVIVTHNMQQASRVSDRCALFLVDGEDDPGRIVESGPTQQVFEDPVDPRTQDYVNGRFG